MLRFTLRELLLVAALVGVCLGWSMDRVEYRRNIYAYRSFASNQMDYLRMLGFEFDADTRSPPDPLDSNRYVICKVPGEFKDRLEPGGVVSLYVNEYVYRDSHVPFVGPTRPWIDSGLSGPVVWTIAVFATAVSFFSLGRIGRRETIAVPMPNSN